MDQFPQAGAVVPVCQFARSFDFSRLNPSLCIAVWRGSAAAPGVLRSADAPSQGASSPSPTEAHVSREVPDRPFVIFSRPPLRLRCNQARRSSCLLRVDARSRSPTNHRRGAGSAQSDSLQLDAGFRNCPAYRDGAVHLSHLDGCRAPLVPDTISVKSGREGPHAVTRAVSQLQSRRGGVS